MPLNNADKITKEEWLERKLASNGILDGETKKILKFLRDNDDDYKDIVSMRAFNAAEKAVNKTDAITAARKFIDDTADLEDNIAAAMTLLEANNHTVTDNR